MGARHGIQVQRKAQELEPQLPKKGSRNALSRQSFKVAVNRLKTETGVTRFCISIEPVPVMRWHDVPNARELLRGIVSESFGKVDRQTVILKETMQAISRWSDKGQIFPTHWEDADEYIPLLSRDVPDGYAETVP